MTKNDYETNPYITLIYRKKPTKDCYINITFLSFYYVKIRGRGFLTNTCTK